MTYRRPCRRSVSSLFFSPANKKTKLALAVAALSLATLTCFAQTSASDDQSQVGEEPDPQSGQMAEAKGPTAITIPSGTRIALVLTHPIQTRYIHRGDDIYAQISSPVNAGDEVVIPVGTFVQGKVEKIERNGGRGELHLQSMAITFPDGYVAPVAGPIILESSDGYALKDPGGSRAAGAFALPAVGAGVGALIGYAAANKNPGTLTASIPPGCTGPPPGCLSSSTSVPAHPGTSIGIGAGVGAAAGMIASLFVLTGTHNFYLDVGSPVEMTLEHPITLKGDEVASAVRDSQQHPVAQQPVAMRPQPLPLPPNEDHGTCYSPGTPGTPDTIIPGPPTADGTPGPSTVIPGIPATPGSSYPCP